MEYIVKRQTSIARASNEEQLQKMRSEKEEVTATVSEWLKYVTDERYLPSYNGELEEEEAVRHMSVVMTSAEVKHAPEMKLVRPNSSWRATDCATLWVNQSDNPLPDPRDHELQV